MVMMSATQRTAQPARPPASPSACPPSQSDESLAQIARLHLLDDASAGRGAELFKALADPTRLRIVGLLAHTEACVGDLCTVLGMSQPAVSYQLRILRTLRIVAARKEGKHVFYRLADEHVHQLFRQGLDHVRHG